jgi:hypothetical protein
VTLPTLLLPLLLPLLCLAAGNRQAAQAPKVSVEVKAVTVYATVRDKHGHIACALQLRIGAVSHGQECPRQGKADRSWLNRAGEPRPYVDCGAGGRTGRPNTSASPLRFA